MSKRGVRLYDSIKKEAEKPANERKLLKKGKVPRRYHLMDYEIKQLEQKRKIHCRFPNPYKYGSIAYAIIESLVELGTNRKHYFHDVRNKFKDIMSNMAGIKGYDNAWIAFKSKESRNKFTGRDVTGRILQNIYMYQRLNGYHPYGEKLRQLRACINVYCDDNGLPLFELKTDFKKSDVISPINEMINKK